MPSLVRTRLTYEQDLSFFNVAPSAFARSLMGTVGKMKKTSGCFAHEIRVGGGGVVFACDVFEHVARAMCLCLNKRPGVLKLKVKGVTVRLIKT